MLAKVAFVLVFEFVVNMICNLIEWLVYDQPHQVRIKVRKEIFEGRKLLYDYDKADGTPQGKTDKPEAPWT